MDKCKIRRASVPARLGIFLPGAILVSAALLRAPAFADTPASPPAAVTPGASGDPQSPDVTIDVTANRTPQPVTSADSSITVITRDQIEAKDPFDLTDIITMAPGVSIAQSGSRGQNADVFIRGADSDDTLVLMDGVPVNTFSNGAFDFGSVPVENIEQIEILRGPQSALYGSDAIGGVINIITRKGTGKLRATGSVEYGDFDTERENADVSGKIGSDSLSFDLTHIKTAGFFQNDDFHSVGSSVRYDHPLTAVSDLSVIGRYSSGGLGVPGQALLALNPSERNAPKDLDASVQYTRNDRRRRDWVSLGILDRTLADDSPASPASPDYSSTSSFYDQVVTLQGQSTLQMGRHAVTGGLEAQDERASAIINSDYQGAPSASAASHARTVLALSGQDEFRSGGWDVVPGVRLEDNTQSGTILSGRLAAGYALAKRSRLKASVGTGFHAPTFDDLYYPGSGNPNLRPEKSVGFDAGYEYSLGTNRLAEVTVFRNEFQDLIQYVQMSPTSFVPENVGLASTSGVEVGLRGNLCPGLTGVLNYGYLHTSPGLLRRPRFSGTADLLYRRKKVHADLGVVAQGQRLDNDFFNDTSNRMYNGFGRVDLTTGYDLRRDLQVYTRIQNLFNQKYTEVAGYPAPLFNFVVGFKATTF